MTAIEIISKASNPPTLFLGIASVFAGTATAAVRSNLEILPAILCLLFAIFAQIAANLCHRYFDDRYQIGENESDRLYADGDRKGTAAVIYEGMVAAAILAAMLGLSIMTMAGWWTLIFALLIIVVAVICNIGPRPLSRTPFYILATFFLFGPISVIGTSLVQSQHSQETLADVFNWYDVSPALFMSIVVGLMAVNEHILFNYRSYIDDRNHQRVTAVVKFGRKKARRLFFINGPVYWAVALVSTILENYEHYIVIMVLPTLSLLLNSYIAYRMKDKDPRNLDTLQDLSHANLILFTLLSLIVVLILGLPLNDNHRFF